MKISLVLVLVLILGYPLKAQNTEATKIRLSHQESLIQNFRILQFQAATKELPNGCKLFRRRNIIAEWSSFSFFITSPV